MGRVRSRTVAGVAAGLTLIGAGTGVAIAQSSGSNGSNETGSPPGQTFLAEVAERLGIEESALKDAIKGAALEEVDQALADGKITQEQADAIKSRIDSGGFPGFRLGGPGLGGHWLGGHWLGGPPLLRGEPSFLSTAAGYLGLTEDELTSRLEGGSSLGEVATAEGKSVDGLEQALVDAAAENLDEAVAAGKLTESQKQDILENVQASVDDLVEGTGPLFRRHPRAFGAGLFA